MDSIKIDVGIKRVCINDDETRVIEFNPTDVTFAERFYSLVRDFDAKQADYLARAEAIQTDDVESGLALLHEICDYMRGQIDFLFGEGSSQAAFGEALSLDAIGQFLEGITPFIQFARAEKLAKYSPQKKGKRVLK